LSRLSKNGLLLSTVTDYNPIGHHLKASGAITSTLEEILISCKLVHPSKALAPIYIKVPSNDIELKL
jgi:hypothetical protein